MKNIITLLLALCAISLVSCTGMAVPVLGGYLEFGPPQQVVGGGVGPTQPWGQKIVTTQKHLTEEVRGASIRIKGSPPAEVLVQVRDAVGHWCERTHTTQGVWPTYAEATEQAKKEFGKRGYNLVEAETPGPDSFKIVEYNLHNLQIGEPIPTGEPTVETVDVMEVDVPPSILARSRAGEVGILYDNDQGQP